MAAASIYSDWITLPSGSASRLTRLRLYIKDLADQLQVALQSQYEIHGREVNPEELADLRSRIEKLEDEERRLSEIVGLGDGTFQGFTSGRPRL